MKFPLAAMVPFACLALAGCQQRGSHDIANTVQVAPVNGPSAEVGEALEANDIVVRLARHGGALVDPAAETTQTALELRNAIRLFGSAGATPVDAEQRDLVSDWQEAANRLDPDGDQPVYRGRALGPAYRSGSLQSGKAMRTSQLFLAGKQAKIGLSGSQSDHSFQLEVRDDSGKLVCAKRIKAAAAGCRFMPLYSARYEIAVINRSTARRSFVLVTN